MRPTRARTLFSQRSLEGKQGEGCSAPGLRLVFIRVGSRSLAPPLRGSGNRPVLCVAVPPPLLSAPLRLQIQLYPVGEEYGHASPRACSLGSSRGRCVPRSELSVALRVVLNSFLSHCYSNWTPRPVLNFSALLLRRAPGCACRLVCVLACLTSNTLGMYV